MAFASSEVLAYVFSLFHLCTPCLIQQKPQQPFAHSLQCSFRNQYPFTPSRLKNSNPYCFSYVGYLPEFDSLLYKKNRCPMRSVLKDSKVHSLLLCTFFIFRRRNPRCFFKFSAEMGHLGISGSDSSFCY